MLLTSLALAFVPTTAAVLSPDDEIKVDYAAILEHARERYALEDVVLEDYSFEKVLDSEFFFRMQLGPWDVRIPVHEAVDRNGASLIREAATVTLDVATEWARWTMGPEEAAQVEEDVDTLQKWMKGWSDRKFKQANEESGSSLFERMSSADEEVRAAGQRLANNMSLGTNPDGSAPAEMVFVPTRRSFAELMTLAGAIEPSRRKILWGKDSVFLSAAWSANVHIVALEWAIWPWNASQPYIGESLNTHQKTGRRQHIVERASASLTRGAFNSIASPLLEQALHVNMIVDIIGADYPTFSTWSFQFSRAGGSTAPYSRFVPGGNSAGGTLPPRPAQAGPGMASFGGTEKSEYRENDGEDYFLEALEKGQKQGAKLVHKTPDVPDDVRRDKRAHFEIGVAGKGDRTIVSAPFLGAGAEKKKTPPKEFIDDYEEFFRSYRTCFVHWLRTEGHPDGKAASAEAFGRLLDRARRRSEDDTLASMVLEVYGIPLSAPNGDTESLEWSFLEYVSK